MDPNTCNCTKTDPASASICHAPLASSQARVGVFPALLGLDRATQARAREAALEVIGFMGLESRRDQLASELPLGSQRALAMAIALASRPKLLLLDEPFAGMNAEETDRMMDKVRDIRDRGMTVLLVGTLITDYQEVTTKKLRVVWRCDPDRQ